MTTTLKEVAKTLNITRPALISILKELGQKNFYKDNQVISDEIITEVKSFLESQANKEAGKQATLPPSKDEIQNLVSNTQESDLSKDLNQDNQGFNQDNFQLNSSEMAVIQSAQARGEILADMASAVFANSFLSQETNHQIAFARRYLNKVNKELTGLSCVTEKDLLAHQSGNKSHQETEMDFLRKQQDSLKEKSLVLKGKYQLNPYF